MNQEELESLNLDDLPYPMFKTTVKEKNCLLKALPIITEDSNNYFLCHILQRQVDDVVSDSIREKVNTSVGNDYTLSDCLGLGHLKDDVLHAELRRIWIRKLLEYKGE